MTDVQIIKFKDGPNRATFEIICKPGAPLEFRDGRLDIDSTLETDEIFKDFKKGVRASDAEIETSFNTLDRRQICQIILEQGEIQYTTEERRSFVEKKKNEIINYICKYYVDPRTRLPHPRNRIENALEELKVRVDPHIEAKKQAKDIVKTLPEILPIRKMVIEATITIPHKFLGQIYGVFKDIVNIVSENYNDTGCAYSVTLVPGDYDVLMADLNALCKDEFDISIVGAPQDTIPIEENQTTRGGKKGGRGRGRGGKRKNN